MSKQVSVSSVSSIAIARCKYLKFLKDLAALFSKFFVTMLLSISVVEEVSQFEIQEK